MQMWLWLCGAGFVLFVFLPCTRTPTPTLTPFQAKLQLPPSLTVKVPEVSPPPPALPLPGNHLGYPLRIPGATPGLSWVNRRRNKQRGLEFILFLWRCNQKVPAKLWGQLGGLENVGSESDSCVYTGNGPLCRPEGHPDPTEGRRATHGLVPVTFGQT